MNAFDWAAFYAAIGGRYAFLALQLSAVCFAAWVVYGWRTDHAEEVWPLAELVPFDEYVNWTEWEVCN